MGFFTIFFVKWTLIIQPTESKTERKKEKLDYNLQGDFNCEDTSSKLCFNMKLEQDKRIN